VNANVKISSILNLFFHKRAQTEFGIFFKKHSANLEAGLFELFYIAVCKPLTSQSVANARWKSDGELWGS